MASVPPLSSKPVTEGRMAGQPATRVPIRAQGASRACTLALGALDMSRKAGSRAIGGARRGAWTALWLACAASAAQAQVPDAPSVAASRAESAGPARRHAPLDPRASEPDSTVRGSREGSGALAPTASRAASQADARAPVGADPQGLFLFATLLAGVGYVMLKRKGA